MYTHTALPSVKGQVTLPHAIRKKYHITKQTPIVIEDKGRGVIIMKIMQIVPQDAIQYYETEKERGLIFQKGIDPKAIIDVIKKIDG